jgi:hypothetical protein
MLNSESRGIRDFTVWCIRKVGLIRLLLSAKIPSGGDELTLYVLQPHATVFHRPDQSY